MRFFLMITLLLPRLLAAEEITVSTSVTGAVIYPQGATITRTGQVQIPEGVHELVIADMPANIDLSTLKMAAAGVRLGGLRARVERTPPHAIDNAALRAAEEKIDRAKNDIRLLEDKIALAQTKVDAANAKIRLLSTVQAGENQAIVAGELSALLTVVARETVTAREEALAAGIDIRALELTRRDLEEALQKAIAERDALVPETTDRAHVTARANAQTPTEATVTIEYQIYQAHWQPIYSLDLDQSAQSLTLTRAAMIQQDTGENWDGVSIRLSTARPSGRITPTELHEDIRRIGPPHIPMPLVFKENGEAMQMDLSADAAVGSRMAEPAMEATTAMGLSGLLVEYTLPEPARLASGVDAAQFDIGTLSFPAKIYARAVPSRDQTAYLMAEVENTSGQILLGSGKADRYVDGKFMGSERFDTLAEGDQADLAFGPVEGLVLEQAIRRKEEGDRGFVRRANAEEEIREVTVTNRSGIVWPVRLTDRIPVSEQEDLEITWRSRPDPTSHDLDDKRGVLEWRFDLAPQETRRIEIETTLTWPEDQILQ